MPGATLEIHQINVSQGDATLIIVRDLALLAAKVTDATAQADPMAHLPWCVKSSVDISSTVVSAVLIDGGNNRFGDKVWAYMKQVGAIDPSPAVVFQAKLHVMVNHAHGDHLDGLESLFRYVDPSVLPARAAKRARTKLTAPFTLVPASLMRMAQTPVREPRGDKLAVCNTRSTQSNFL